MHHPLKIWHFASLPGILLNFWNFHRQTDLPAHGYKITKTHSTWPHALVVRDALAGDELAPPGMDESQLPLRLSTSDTCVMSSSKSVSSGVSAGRVANNLPFEASKKSSAKQLRNKPYAGSCQ